jgi:hypothetical protein
MCVCVGGGGGIVVCGVRKNSHGIPTRVPGLRPESPHSAPAPAESMSGPNGATPGAPVALRYPPKGTASITFGVCGQTLLNPCLAAELNGGGSALATPAEFHAKVGAALGSKEAGLLFHFLTFRWQPHGTISARPAAS